MLWGHEHMALDDIKAIGIDEILWHKGHQYLTVVYQIDEHRKRLLWLGDKRRVKTLLKFFRWFGKQRSGALEFICSDMWQPYLKVIAKKASQAVHVLDRFHILRSVRSYLLKEDFQFFWEYVSPYWAGRFLDRWCTRVMRSQIKPMKKVAHSLRKHRVLLLNWFRAKGAISAGVVEGFNNKAKLTTRKAFGFRTFKAAEVALFHTLGDLPEPEMTHRFC